MPGRQLSCAGALKYKSHENERYYCTHIGLHGGYRKTANCMVYRREGGCDPLSRKLHAQCCCWLLQQRLSHFRERRGELPNLTVAREILLVYKRASEYERYCALAAGTCCVTRVWCVCMCIHSQRRAVGIAIGKVPREGYNRQGRRKVRELVTTSRGARWLFYFFLLVLLVRKKKIRFFFFFSSKD